jgi:hypothetical protein
MKEHLLSFLAGWYTSRTFRANQRHVLPERERDDTRSIAERLFSSPQLTWAGRSDDVRSSKQGHVAVGQGMSLAQ